MLWKCLFCGETFDEPSIHHYRENLDDENGWQDFYVPLCPYCGDEDVDPIPDDDDGMTLEEVQEIERRDFEEWEERQWHM